ncbi:16S rRNA (cytosine1402-N4)-methyltransferase [Syntrophus gentianae]|uniref:Ribosomal RNA small subunit methyltransferase H n=1 Tax=Syntrophus gentianae TaxID=43775 RepID=A0A1H7X4M8_9BACT|nr:16S rRNA (cytosine(1402)-N(4))-methyltransferase RsmH [Syntrophus gentianae]SEM28832.1 16S rRNA (cytosine1402-N4)-methyltransferase [Syntrophus gentianae]
MLVERDAYHEPVLLEEAVASLNCRSGGVYVDGTVGGGGHAGLILERSAPDGFLLGMDVDSEALEAAEKHLMDFGRRKHLVKANYANIREVLTDQDISKVDGILLDLGVSSHQLDTAERGFSFLHEAPLDMRMDPQSGRSAYDVVNACSERELKEIIRQYGEEIMAGRIARAIAAKRKEAPIRTTTRLAAIVVGALPGSARHKKIHPATRTFQALRIYVNNELANLYRAIQSGTDCLKSGGRFSIISFHSLEDGIVKNSFRSLEKGCICPTDMPFCSCGQSPRLKVVSRKPVSPSNEEVAANPRARSARLRTAERI